MRPIADEDLDLVQLVLGELVATLLAIHFDPPTLREMAASADAEADEQDARAAAGIVVLRPQPTRSATRWRILADFYAAAAEKAAPAHAPTHPPEGD